MNSLRRLDDRLLGAVLGYATYGLVLVAALMLAALLIRRTGSDRALAATGWAAPATLIAVAAWLRRRPGMRNAFGPVSTPA